MAANPAKGKDGSKAARKGGVGASDALLRAPPLPKTVSHTDLMATVDEFLAVAMTYSGQAARMRQAFVHAALSADRQPCGDLRDAALAASGASRRSVEAAVQVARKNVLALDPSLKRLVCTECSALLLPGIAATYRTRPSGPHKRLVQVRCHSCNHVRRWPAPPLVPEADSESLEPIVAGAPASNRPTRPTLLQSVRASIRPQASTSPDAVQPHSVHAPIAKRRISQRQRRRNGKQVRLVARALEGKQQPTSRLAGLHIQPGIADRAQRLAHRHAPPAAVAQVDALPPPSRIESTSQQVSQSASDLLAVYSDVALAFPTRQERLTIRNIERASRHHASKPINPSRPTKSIPLPPFHERMQGSDWAGHLARSTLVAAATAQGQTAPLPPEHEEAAARALRGGGHVVL